MSFNIHTILKRELLFVSNSVIQLCSGFCFYDRHFSSFCFNICFLIKKKNYMNFLSHVFSFLMKIYVTYYNNY